jgi:hypothetical protein
MPIASSISEEAKLVDKILIWLALTFSGSYVPGGDTLDLTQVQNTTGHAIEGFFEPPTNIGVFSESAGGYYCQVILGATLQTYKLKVFAPGGAEVGAVTYASIGFNNAQVTLLATRRAM